MLNVTILKVPGRVVDVTLEDGQNKVSDALAAAEMDASGYDIKVSGREASGTTVVEDGARIYLTKQIKGNL